MVDRGQLREIQRNVFSNTLFVKLQSVCGKVKLALNQLYIDIVPN